MCRMMGIISKKPVKADWLWAFEPLAAKGKIRSDMKEPGHHDGWGLVTYYTENFPEYVERQPHSVTQDSDLYKNAARLVERAKCKGAMAHFRKVSVGGPLISNTHPFLYKEWAFAHNGTIFNSEKIPLQNLKPYGSTDSERFFFYLMEQIQPFSLDQKTLEAGLKNAVEKIRAQFEHSSLTFLLTNGKTFYAYRECDPQYSDYYTLYGSEIDGSKLYCSEPLLEVTGQWQAVGNQSLVSAQV